MKQHIVFVDDMPQLLQIAEAMLERLGFRVTGFVSSSKALEFLQANLADVDLVITDQSMPDMTGIDLVQAVIRMPEAPPVVLATSLMYVDRIEDYRELGVHHLLPKPFSLSDVEHAVTTALNSTD
ncbi:MAG: response regulator [Pseudomonadota bacterium]